MKRYFSKQFLLDDIKNGVGKLKALFEFMQSPASAGDEDEIEPAAKEKIMYYLKGLKTRMVEIIDCVDILKKLPDQLNSQDHPDFAHTSPADLSQLESALETVENRLKDIREEGAKLGQVLETLPVSEPTFQRLSSKDSAHVDDHLLALRESLFPEGDIRRASGRKREHVVRVTPDNARERLRKFSKWASGYDIKSALGWINSIRQDINDSRER